MSESWERRSLRLLVLLVYVWLQFIPGFSDSDDSKNGTRVGTHTSTSSTGSMVVIIFFVLVTVALFSFFLFKLWQRKKREEQYARLLKLFEEDDELELELGLRD
ncbi:hypothetical protein FNV43_RR06466 [Rhamnella rubrinervis]|uniref:Uncharacterized protein n=1 Tax=Rhamnella rubrinervis TaxID=2594499 RepID=A0A8K0HDH0_9ROSA|nr:hypothetical protein FNV43_RR06466 [Rhamnella rubrinervis]